MSWLVVRAAPWPRTVPSALLRRALERWSPCVRALAPPPDLAVAADLGRVSEHRAREIIRVIRDQLTHDLRDRRTDTPSVPLACGLGAQLTIAELAAQAAEPGGIVVVPPGQEALWLAPQPIARLPLEPALIARLRQFGLGTVGALAALPLDALEAQFGAAGRHLHALANGQPQPLPPAETDPPCLRLGWRFAGSVIDQPSVDAALDRVARRLAARLARTGQAARHITLTLDLADAPPRQAAHVLTEPTSDPRHLSALLRALARDADVPCGVERLVVTAELAPVQAVQHELFPQPPARAAQLEALISHLAPRLTAHLVHTALPSPHAPCLEQRVAFTPWVQP